MPVRPFRQGAQHGAFLLGGGRGLGEVRGDPQVPAVRWNVVAANRACAPLFGGDRIGANMVRRYFGDRAAAEWMVNWAEVDWAGLGRLRQQLHRAPFDEELG